MKARSWDQFFRNSETSKRRNTSSTNEMERATRLVSKCARRPHRAQIAFTFALLCSIGTISTILFSTLHMVVFVEVLGLNANDIVTSQALYFVWNVLNDLLGGVLVHMWQNIFGSKLTLVTLLSVAYIASSCLPFFTPFPGISIGNQRSFRFFCCFDFLKTISLTDII